MEARDLGYFILHASSILLDIVVGFAILTNLDHYGHRSAGIWTLINGFLAACVLTYQLLIVFDLVCDFESDVKQRFIAYLSLFCAAVCIAPCIFMQMILMKNIGADGRVVASFVTSILALLSMVFAHYEEWQKPKEEVAPVNQVIQERVLHYAKKAKTPARLSNSGMHIALGATFLLTEKFGILMLILGCFGFFANALDAKAKWSKDSSRQTWRIPETIKMAFPAKNENDWYGSRKLKSFIHCFTFCLEDLPCLFMILIAVSEAHFSKLLFLSLSATVASMLISYRWRNFEIAWSFMKKVDWHQYLCCFFPIRFIHAVLSFILGSSISQNDEYKGVGIAILVSGMLQACVFCGNCAAQCKAESRQERGLAYVWSSCCLVVGNDIHCMAMECVAIGYNLYTEIAVPSVVFSIFCLCYSCFSVSFPEHFSEEMEVDVEMVKRSPDTEKPEDLNKTTQTVTGGSEDSNKILAVQTSSKIEEMEVDVETVKRSPDTEKPEDLNTTTQAVTGGSEDSNKILAAQTSSKKLTTQLTLTE